MDVFPFPLSRPLASLFPQTVNEFSARRFLHFLSSGPAIDRLTSHTPLNSFFSRGSSFWALSPSARRFPQFLQAFPCSCTPASPSTVLPGTPVQGRLAASHYKNCDIYYVASHYLTPREGLLRFCGPFLFIAVGPQYDRKPKNALF